MSWLEQHLETFVRPVLGYVPTTLNQPPPFSPWEMAVIKNAWRSVKRAAKGKPILLPGRDVWTFEVLARRENYPTKFIPQCSRLAIENIEIPNVQDYLLADTGFMGSIPRALGTDVFWLLSHIVQGQSTKQIFPHLQGARQLALKIEYLPKYWLTGFAREGLVGQEFSNLTVFADAAILTQQIYKDSTPKFVERPKESVCE